MLVCTRAQIEACLAEHGFSYMTDSTNLLPDARRNRLRQRVIPLLREENPAVAQTVFRTCALLRADNAFLDARAREALQAAQLPNGRQPQRAFRLAGGRAHPRGPAAARIDPCAQADAAGISTRSTGCCSLRAPPLPSRCRAALPRGWNTTGCT